MLYKDIQKLVNLVENSGIAELEWKKDKECIRICKDVSATVVGAPHLVPPAIVQHTEVAENTRTAPASKLDTSKTKEILSPFVGTYYGTPGTGKPPYVTIGKAVEKGDVLCIIEAMKIMNEIEAEFSGKIVGILAEQEGAVEYGQLLFLIEPK